MRDVQQILDKSKESAVIPDGIIVVNRDYTIIVFNDAAFRITGFKEEEILDKSIAMLFPSDSNDISYFREVFKEQRTFTNLSVTIRIKSGIMKNLLASVMPVKRSDEIISAVFVIRDTNEMLSMANQLEERTQELINQRNKLDAIFNSNIEGTFTIDNDWSITSFNVAAEKITGYTKEEAIGKKCYEIFNSSMCRNGCHMEETLKNGKSGIGNELGIYHKNGTLIPIRVNSGILLNNNNEKIGAVETFIDVSEIRNLSDHLKEQYKYGNIIGKTKQMEKVFSMLESVSKTTSSVLITGESGTGKELIARAIHLNSQRQKGPFIALNCTAFAESLIESELFGHEKGAFTGALARKTGRFEMAKGGTLFLDEIGDISIAIQTKLLRILETRTFERVGGTDTISMDTRIIAATNKDLLREIEKGNFREDLYYRINVMNIHLPPLRDRMDDFPLLIQHFLDHFNTLFNKRITHFSSEAYTHLTNYRFPGNIRELENVIEHSFVLCDGKVIKANHLPERILHKPENVQIQRENIFEKSERELLLAVLTKHNYNRKKTAAELGIHATTLWRKMKKFDIRKNE